MSEIWVNKEFEIDGDAIEIDHATYQTLNILAAKFYKVLKYETEGYHDFYASTHPMENNMFEIALRAYAYQITCGMD